MGALPPPQHQPYFLDECHNTDGLLLSLPDAVLLAHLLPFVAPGERKAFRQLCSRARELVNSLVTSIAVDGGELLQSPHLKLGSRFPHLKTIYARDNSDSPITDDLFINFLRGSPLLLQLRCINLKRSLYVTGRTLRFLGEQCPRLQQLQPSRWTDACALQHLASLRNLQHLDLGDADVDVCQIDDATLAAAALVTSLSSLCLQRCKWITDSAMVPLARLEHLQSLNLSSTSVTGQGLLWLAGKTPIQELYLADCRQVDDTGLQCIAQLPLLNTLVLSNTAVTNAGLAHIGDLEGLETLDLGARFQVNDAGLRHLAGCAALASLCAGSVHILAPRSSRGFESLSHLELGGVFPSKGLRQLFPLPALTSLRLAGIDTATDATLRHVASQTSLERLQVSGGYQLTAGGLAALRPLRRLASLGLSACPLVDVPAVRSLSADLEQLTELQLSCCPQLGLRGQQHGSMQRSLSLPAGLAQLG
jgi:hypothetical protein